MFLLNNVINIIIFFFLQKIPKSWMKNRKYLIDTSKNCWSWKVNSLLKILSYTLNFWRNYIQDELIITYVSFSDEYELWNQLTVCRYRCFLLICVPYVVYLMEKCVYSDVENVSRIFKLEILKCVKSDVEKFLGYLQ